MATIKLSTQNWSLYWYSFKYVVIYYKNWVAAQTQQYGSCDVLDLNVSMDNSVSAIF